MRWLALAAGLVLAAVGMSGAAVGRNEGAVQGQRTPATGFPPASCKYLYGSQLIAYDIAFGNSMGIKALLPHHPTLTVRAYCLAGRHGGWYLRAVGSGGTSYRSSKFSYDFPIAVLGLYDYSRRYMPAVLAQVGVGMTGQPYELFTFEGSAIVPARMTFPSPGLGELAGGGAAEHGQGVFCASRGGDLLVTQVHWSGPVFPAPTVTYPNGGESAAPGDSVTVQYERWALTGQPLRQLRVSSLPSKTMSYRAATSLENAHCRQ